MNWQQSIGRDPRFASPPTTGTIPFISSAAWSHVEETFPNCEDVLLSPGSSPIYKELRFHHACTIKEYGWDYNGEELPVKAWTPEKVVNRWLQKREQQRRQGPCKWGMCMMPDWAPRKDYCYFCKDPGHMAKDCPQKSRQGNQGFKRRAPDSGPRNQGGRIHRNQG